MKTKRVNNIFLNNHYSYDFVGNIKSFENTAGATTNKMAGDFSYTYTYDKLNRLKTANGNFSGYSGDPAPTFGDLSANYTLAMEYDNLHNITHKIQQHYKNNILFNENSYKNQYNYSQDKPHQLESIQDGNTTEYFGYDPNGNLHRHTSVDDDWIYFWDEANRLRSAIINGVKMMHYIYDASGERTLKAQTEYQGVFENGTPTDEGSTLTVYTTYPSPYLTISPDKKFTNHYYAGSQRIASKPAGNADRFNVMQAGEISALEELRAKQLADAQFVADSMELGQLNLAQPGSGVIFIPVVFYFHPDHLGSSTLITDNFGDPYQFFLNLPFGETFAEQRRSGSFDNPYKFNDYGGKSFKKAFDEHTARSAELDEEIEERDSPMPLKINNKAHRQTGLYYYGARYYNPRTSVFISVDPLTEQTMTPYQYTYQNPVRYIDPTGMAAEGWGERVHKNGKSTWEYSHHITKDNYKDLGYSDYIDSGNLISTTNGVADGKYNYSLNADGTVQNSQGAFMRNKFKTKGGTTISNLDKDTSMVAMARTAYMSGNHDPAYSPYTPDAMSVNIGASGNLYVANYDVSLSLIFSPGNISIGGNAGGGLGMNSDMPFKNFSPFNPNVSLGFHDMYGDENNVLKGLSEWSVNSTYSGGPFSISRSTSATFHQPNALLAPAPSGVKSTYLGVAPRSANIGVSGFGSYSVIGNLIKNN